LEPRVMRSEVTGDSHSPPGLSCFLLLAVAAIVAAVEDEGRREDVGEKIREENGEEISPLFLREEERAEAAAEAAATRTTAATAVEVEVEERRRC